MNDDNDIGQYPFPPLDLALLMAVVQFGAIPPISPSPNSASPRLLIGVS